MGKLIDSQTNARLRVLVGRGLVEWGDDVRHDEVDGEEWVLDGRIG